MSDELTGYLHPAYAASLADWGEPLLLPLSDGWLIVRDIPGTNERDAMGCYPVFNCRNWEQLDADFAALEGLVAVSLVTDPFGDFERLTLQRAFPDRCIPFKEHFVVDLSISRAAAVSSHHRRTARQALRHFRVEVCSRPHDFLEDWVRLYQLLITRHSIIGPQSFSHDIFERQFNVPGFTLFRAVHDGVNAGMAMWYEQGGVAYLHLSASDATGYKWGGASYALLWTAWDWFAPRVRWLSLGAGAGSAVQDNGLSRFKRGWATTTRWAYFCGRVLDRKRYDALACRRAKTKYFPIYRAGEFMQGAA
jgi:PAS domain-containing protein